MIDNSLLKERLNTIWKEPDFSTFFQTYAKRPSLKIKKGGMIFYEGDVPGKIYFIKSGFVKMYQASEKDRDSIIYLYGPGSILGVRALTSKDEALRHSAQGLTEVEVVTLSRDDYLEILSTHPNHIIDLLNVFIERLKYTERKLDGFILTNTQARVASFLYNCTQRFGEKKENLITLPFPLTHQLIADFVGAFRETVTLAINKLEKEKIIIVEKGTVTILDLEKLELASHKSDDL